MSRLLSRLRLLWIGCALAALASQAEAAPASGRETWVLNFNYGAGNLSMEGDSLGRDFGMGPLLRLGHIVEPNITAGFQARAWNSSESDSTHGSNTGTTDLTRNVQIFTMTVTMFPAGLGFYARGGAGVCKVRQEFLVHDPLGGPSVVKAFEDAGFAVTAAGGWEYRARRRLGLALDVEYTRFVAAHIGGNLFSYTGGLNYYW
jgi:hypothetical protein